MEVLSGGRMILSLERIGTTMGGSSHQEFSPTFTSFGVKVSLFAVRGES